MRKPLLISAGIFSGLSIWAALTSKGFLEADACTHFMFSRFAFNEPYLFVNVWGRPVVTALYAIQAAKFGLFAVQLTSLAVALAIALVAYRIAKNQEYRWPALAFVCTLAQPMLFLHSFSVLTELPFALIIGLAFLAYQQKKWLAMALLLSIAPACRPEGFGFIVLGAIALIAHRRWYWLAILPLGLIAWSYAGWRVSGQPIDMHWWQWLGRNLPYSKESTYGSGDPLQFVALLPAIVSPVFLPFVWIGVARSAGDPRAHRQRCQMLIAMLPLMILVGHSFLWWAGKMASNGEPRYLLTMSPFWALLAAYGVEWVWMRFNWPRPILIAGVASLLPIAFNFYYMVIPLQEYEDDRMARQFAKWYYSDPQIQKNYPRIMVSIPAIYYHMDISGSDPLRSVGWGPKNVDAMPPGTVMVWDEVYGMHNADANVIVTEDHIRNATSWVWNQEFQDGYRSCEVYLSPKTASGAPTTRQSIGELLPQLER